MDQLGLDIDADVDETPSEPQQEQQKGWDLKCRNVTAKAIVQEEQARQTLLYMSNLSKNGKMGNIGSRLYSANLGDLKNMDIKNMFSKQPPASRHRTVSNTESDAEASRAVKRRSTIGIMSRSKSDFSLESRASISLVERASHSVRKPLNLYGAAFCMPCSPDEEEADDKRKKRVNDNDRSNNNINNKTGKKKVRKSRDDADANICRIIGCFSPISKRPYCLKHSGTRLCEFAGGNCGKCAQGSTRFCIAHGGGRRCTFQGCDKGARDKFFCAAHGGGRRCSTEGCNKSAVGGSSMCTSHGGGKRCKVAGCDKSAQSSTEFCVRHGGGKKCMYINPVSKKRCDRVARGRTNHCASHGGGVRCKLENCNRVAVGKLQLCKAHGSQMK